MRERRRKREGRSVILPRNTDFFFWERWFLSFVPLLEVTLRTNTVTMVLRAHIFPANKECRSKQQHGVHKRPQEIVYKWKDIPCSKRFEVLCVALTSEKSRREIFVRYEYLKWEKTLAAKNEYLIHQAEPEQESITWSWNQRNSSRNKPQISNSGADLPLKVLAPLSLDII